MLPRRQLPVYSPLPLRAVLAGVGGLAVGHREAERDALQAAIRTSYGALRVALTDSGTSALALSLEAVASGVPRAPVALPAYGCYDLATAADQADRPVVLYDLDPQTLAPDLDSLRAAIDRGAAAVVIVHLFGTPVDVAPVQHLCAPSGVTIIEDAAQGVGGSLDGRPLGGFGPVSLLSFGRGKGTTAGRGGALLAVDLAGERVVASATERLGPRARGVAEVPSLAAQWLLGRPELYAIPASLPFLRLGETIYRAPGEATEMSAVATRVLATTLEGAERESSTRRANADRLLKAVRDELPAAEVRWPSGGEPGFLRLPIVLPEAIEVARDSASTARRLGIMPGYPRALSDLEPFRRRCLNAGDGHPGASGLARRLWTLPTHSRLTEGDFTGVRAWLRSVSSG